MLLAFITPVEIGLSLGFFSTLAGSCWFCLKNYPNDSQARDESDGDTR
jgi:hypothetical protein